MTPEEISSAFNEVKGQRPLTQDDSDEGLTPEMDQISMIAEHIEQLMLVAPDEGTLEILKQQLALVRQGKPEEAMELGKRFTRKLKAKLEAETMDEDDEH